VSKYRLDLKAVVSGMAGAAYIAVAVAASPALQRWYRRWGASNSEVGRVLPGDEFVPRPRIMTTRAVTVQAPASRIWPWLLQFGIERGGWYSYDFLEALSGAANFIDGHSNTRIIPELQDLKVGDKVWMHKRIMPLTVVAMEVDRALVFLTRVDIKTGAFFELSGDMPKDYVNSSWEFFLDEAGDVGTRLLVRSRLDYTPSLINNIAWRVFADPISFVMERKMLLTIKRLAESLTPG
jgi:hypothetical protein